MTEVSIVPEVWARLAHAWDDSFTAHATAFAILICSLISAKVRRRAGRSNPQTCYNADYDVLRHVLSTVACLRDSDDTTILY